MKSSIVPNAKFEEAAESSDPRAVAWDLRYFANKDICAFCPEAKAILSLCYFRKSGLQIYLG
jgi:hypothetical protein